MEKLYIGTNLKMYKTNRETVEYISLLSALTENLNFGTVQLFVVPSFPALADVSRLVNHQHIQIGAQNMHWAEKGQFTGEVSPLMLRELAVDIVELGHSERRHIFGETDELIRLKTHSALQHGFTVLLCIGETAEDKHNGRMDDVLHSQLTTALHELPQEYAGRVWIAYEPVWSIGVQGQPADSSYVSARHQAIRSILFQIWGEHAKQIPLLFGGSVNGENAEGYLQCPEVNGLFIGRSAWDAIPFSKLIHRLSKRENNLKS